MCILSILLYTHASVRCDFIVTLFLTGSLENSTLVTLYIKGVYFLDFKKSVVGGKWLLVGGKCSVVGGLLPVSTYQ